MKIYWRKWFQKTELGGWARAIILYQKRPISFKNIILDVEQQHEKGYSVESIVTTYAHVLLIDLWLFIVDIEWKTNV